MNISNKTPISFRLSTPAVEIIKTIALKKGISQASVLEIAVRELAEREKIKPPG